MSGSNLRHIRLQHILSPPILRPKQRFEFCHLVMAIDNNTTAFQDTEEECYGDPYELDSDEERLADEVWVSYSSDDEIRETTKGAAATFPSSREEVLELLAKGSEQTADTLLSAVERRNVDALQLLLENGVNPNLRRPSSSQPIVDTNDVLWDFNADRRQWPAIYITASFTPYTEEQRVQRDKVIELLLAHGAEVFGIFRQPLKIPPDMKKDGGDAPQQGERCVLHALLEDGGYVDPFFRRPDIASQLERRDPQGRTLLLLACRSALGADAAVDTILADVHWDSDKGGYQNDPFVRDDGRKSIFHILVCLGADPTVTDRSGRNAIHHLLESHDSATIPSKQGRPPIIRRSLRYLLSKHGELVKQPNNAGMYPLQAALQRHKRYAFRDKYVDAAELDEIVQDLVASGADTKVLDEDDRLYLENLT